MNIKNIWESFSSLPMGKKLFSKALSKVVPYTGSVSPQVKQLRAGFAQLEMKDHRAVRNHLKSIHAAALMNFAEAASGLALHHSLSPQLRAILVEFQIHYLKKARGTLTAKCELNSESIGVGVHQLESVVTNSSNEVVAKAIARWKIDEIK